MSNNRTIAKNTIALYFRMIVTMLISLYTSRIILEKLGVDDFGIYNAVGGIVGFLSFLNGMLSGGTSRFLTFELGVGNFEKLKRTFSTLLSAHILLAIIIVVLAETVGLWFLYNKLVIPQDRMDAAVFAYHISIITAFFSLSQVPYNSSIIAHEKMNVYAYMSIYEVVAKLLVCYLIGIGDFDKLKLYATLIFLVQVSLIAFYRFYCVSHFEETKYKFILDKKILKPVISFSGWSLFAGGAVTLSSQGVLILLNMFFSPAVVTARAISLQVNHAASLFVENFRTAVRPQIVKLYAAGDYLGSRNLLLQSTKFSYYLMLMVSLPVFFLADPLLHFWLGSNVPDYTTIFLQLVVIQSIFQVFDISFYTALHAKGQLRENALISPTIIFLTFPIVYALFKNGASPVAFSWAYLICFALLGLVVKPLLIIKIVDYSWREILSVFRHCFLVTIVAVLPSFFLNKVLPDGSFLNFVIKAVVIVVIVCLSSYLVGLDKGMREKMNKIVFSKLRK